MKLQRLRIEQFRKFREPRELDHLSPGLNLFAGANEAGKSTLVRAIRAAFFERHRSTSVDDLQPHGDSSAAPSIELDFEHGGQAHRLNKRFVARKRCDLQIGTRHLEGVEAEDHLSQWLGYDFATRGASKADHWGVPGLLWIEQGGTQELAPSVVHALGHLRSALNGQPSEGPDGATRVGALASSTGDAVLAQVKAWRSELLTEQGRPRAHSPLAQALEEVQTLNTELQGLDARIAQYRQQVDELSALRTAHDADLAARPWEALQRQHEEARGKLRAIEALQTRLQHDLARQSQWAQQETLLGDRLTHWREQEAELTQRQDVRVIAQGQRVQAQARMDGLQAQQQEADEAHQRARAQAAAARAHEATQQAHAQQAEWRASLTTLHERARLAQAQQAALRALLALRLPPALSAPDLSALQELAARQRELQVQRQAMATRVSLTLQPGVTVRLDDRPQQGHSEHLLLRETLIDIGAVGQLLIQPGGSDLQALGRQESDCQAQWASLCRRLDLPLDTHECLAAAHARGEAWQSHQQDLKLARHSLDLLAPQGTDALEAQAHALSLRLQEAPSPLPETTEAAPSAALPWAQAQSLLDSAQARLQAYTAELLAASQAHTRAQVEAESAERECLRLATVLGGADHQAQKDDTHSALADLRDRMARLARSVTQQQAEIAESQPQALRIDAERFQLSAGLVHQQHTRRLQDLIRLESTLQAEGAQGLEERRDAAQGELTRAQRRAQELQRRAQALGCLQDKLEGARLELTRRLQAPLQVRMDHYLRLAFPGARLRLDEHLRPAWLERGDGHLPQTDAVEALSFGAREQLGLVSRLAYADLLKAAGKPTLIILDDALVHSDAARMAGMKRCLLDAAQRHQILLFTCHPDRWHDLGVAVRSI